jgi:cation transport ATPase
MALLLGAPLVSTGLVARAMAEPSFTALWQHAFVVVLVFNLVDLLLVDWLVLCTFTPRAFVLPGTEGMAGYKNYWRHFRGFLIGMVVSAVLATIAAAIANQLG